MSRQAPELPFLRRPEPSREAASRPAGPSPNRPGRIAHLLRKCDPSEWGGTETAIERLCQGLEQQGLTSVIYCPRLQRKLASEPWSEVGWPVRRFRAWVPIWGLPEEERRQMIRVGGNLMSFQLLRQLWREPGLKLIHTHTLGRLGGIALTVARARRLPLVVTIHGGVLDLPASLTDGFASRKRGLEWGKVFGLMFRSRRLLEEADAVVTCNPKEAELLQRQYPSQRIVVQPHGIFVEQYREDHREAAWQAFPQLPGRPMLLCVGRIDPVKNQSWLVEQWPAVLRRHPQALLFLAGACTDPVYGGALRHRIRVLGLTKNVFLTGGLPPKDPRLIGLFQAAQGLILSSVSETFGLVIIEAWAAGTPVIASRTSGACALIEPQRNGWLFDLGDGENFHQAVDELLSKPDLAARVVAQGNLVVQEHDQTVVGGRMKALYESLIEEHHALRGLARR